jgi:hypothetical protein
MSNKIETHTSRQAYVVTTHATLCVVLQAFAKHDVVWNGERQIVVAYDALQAQPRLQVEPVVVYLHTSNGRHAKMTMGSLSHHERERYVVPIVFDERR